MNVPRHRVFVLSVCQSLLASATVLAQTPQNHDEHHHDHLHFSHPMVTESPSPDTKLRFDYLWTREEDPAARSTQRGVRVEGEYAFSEAISLALTVPYTWLSADASSGVSGFGNAELSLKGASLRWDERNVLVGGGLSIGFPTGDDATGIGTSRAIELEPFADVAVKRGKLELVGFGRYGTTVRNPDGTDADREVAFDGSALYPLSHRVEALLEIGVGRSLAGEERITSTSIAPGVKLYPFANRSLMFGASAPIGLSGEAHDTRGVLISAFYHF